MTKKEKINSIKEKLQKGNVTFTIKGIMDLGKYDRKTNEFERIPKTFRMSKTGDSVWSSFNGMNVNKWGPTCVTLYTFDMMSNKTTAKIKYQNVQNIEEIKE